MRLVQGYRHSAAPRSCAVSAGIPAVTKGAAFDFGCPQLELRLTATGFLGSEEQPAEVLAHNLVPAKAEKIFRARRPSRVRSRRRRVEIERPHSILLV